MSLIPQQDETWAGTELEEGERRGWGGRPLWFVGLVAGAMLAAFVSSESLAQGLQRQAAVPSPAAPAHATLRLRA